MSRVKEYKRKYIKFEKLNNETNQYKSEQTVNKSHIIEIKKENEILEVLKTFHVSFTGQHLSIYKTINIVKKFYKFQNLVSQSQKFVKKCAYCKNKKIKLSDNDLRHKIKSVIGFSNMHEFNEKLKKLNNNEQ